MHAALGQAKLMFEPAFIRAQDRNKGQDPRKVGAECDLLARVGAIFQTSAPICSASGAVDFRKRVLQSIGPQNRYGLASAVALTAHYRVATEIVAGVREQKRANRANIRKVVVATKHYLQEGLRWAAQQCHTTRLSDGHRSICA